MNADEIRAYRNAKPFRPFSIETSDGESFFVEEAIRMSISPLGNTVLVPKNDQLKLLKTSKIETIRLAEFSEAPNEEQP